MVPDNMRNDALSGTMQVGRLYSHRSIDRSFLPVTSCFDIEKLRLVSINLIFFYILLQFPLIWAWNLSISKQTVLSYYSTIVYFSILWAKFQYIGQFRWFIFLKINKQALWIVSGFGIYFVYFDGKLVWLILTLLL